jgi:type IV secretion system protein VirB6
MGLILTTLIRTAPPMAAVFFQGTLGTFMAYSQIGGGAAATPSSDGRPAGTYTPPAPSKGAEHAVDGNANRVGTPTIPMPQSDGGLTSGKFGSAK